ncbi:MAG: VOC family protein [Luteimonas sp.]
MAVKPIPDGYHSVTPYLYVDDAAKALDFYAKAFGASEIYRLPMGDKIGHAEMQLGDSRFMLADESPQMDSIGPRKRGGATAGFMLYVADVDAAFQRAISAGATSSRAPENQFYGDRTGTVIDPFGHKWSIGTHVEDVDPEEMNRRMAQWSESQS